MTPPRRTDATPDSRYVLLRTSADVLEHTLAQAKALAAEWPQWKDDIERLDAFVRELVDAASGHGYVSKVRQ